MKFTLMAACLKSTNGIAAVYEQEYDSAAFGVDGAISFMLEHYVDPTLPSDTARIKMLVVQINNINLRNENDALDIVDLIPVGVKPEAYCPHANAIFRKQVFQTPTKEKMN